MAHEQVLVAAIYNGWQAYQEALIKALASLDAEGLALHVGPELRSVGQIATHMIGARARWFYLLMGEGGETFEAMSSWDRQESGTRSAEELVRGLKTTWKGMQEAIAHWSLADWKKTWPGEEVGRSYAITRQWVIWHLLEHDLHHGGEISLILGANGLAGVDL